jgi:hypothetical protein
MWSFCIKNHSILKTRLLPRACGGFFSPWLSLLFGVFLVLFLHACSEPDEIGLGLIGGRATYNSTDTLSLLARSSAGGVVPTNLSRNNVLGVMQDPEFGKVRASLYTQFRLPQNDLSLGEDPRLDSMTLMFGYTGKYYGQVEMFQHLRVYELSEGLPEADSLFSDLSLARYPEPIAERLLRPAPTDSVPIDTIMTAPHFQVRLSDAFGQKFIDANGTPAFENVPNFLDYFKGLYITVDEDIEEFGSIFSLDMYSFYTKLSLFYRKTPEDTLSTRFDFYINEFTQRANYFEGFGGEGINPLLLSQLQGEDPYAAGDSLLFVQSMGRVRAHIQMPYLKDLSEMANVTINQARLILPAADGFATEMFPEAERLLLQRFAEDGTVSQLPDIFLGENYFGGTWDPARRQYVFNVTQYLQEVMDGRIGDHGLALSVRFPSENAQRVVLNGPAHPDRPMRLEIIYTVFN